KRFAGVFAAAPSVALAGLVVTLFAKGASSAQRSALGMVAGAVAFVVYALVTPATVRRLGALLGASVSIVGWLAVAAMGLAVVGVATSSKAAALGVAGRPEDVSGRPRLRLEPGKLSEAKPSELLVRFAFGAGVSAVAGTLSLVWGPLVGGAFLAFPAILLATLTMVADDEGQAAARDEARGPAAGALGLVA